MPTKWSIKSFGNKKKIQQTEKSNRWFFAPSVLLNILRYSSLSLSNDQLGSARAQKKTRSRFIIVRIFIISIDSFYFISRLVYILAWPDPSCSFAANDSIRAVTLQRSLWSVEANVTCHGDYFCSEVQKATCAADGRWSDVQCLKRIWRYPEVRREGASNTRAKHICTDVHTFVYLNLEVK